MSDLGELKKLAVKLGTDGPVKTLPTPRLIRLLHSGQYIIQTTKAVFVWEHPYYPQLYIPSSDISTKSSVFKITKGEAISTSSGTEVATQWTLTVGDKSIHKILHFSPSLSGPAAPLADLVKIDFASVDQWFEEDTPMFVHPKDPFKRVDILSSTRPIKVRVGGKVVAEAKNSAHLYETGLPVRYYLPFTSLDASVLRPSSTKTKCPYKGEAEYYSVEVDGKLYEDVVWYYRQPLLESIKVEGLLCFYNEKVEIELDGEKLETPVTHFSNKKPNAKPPGAV